MDNENKIVTVKELIEDLQQMDGNAPVEIAIMQYNKVHPVAYCNPFSISKAMGGRYIATTNGHRVRIPVFLPDDEETFMYTSKKKK